MTEPSLATIKGFDTHENVLAFKSKYLCIAVTGHKFVFVLNNWIGTPF